MSELIPILSSDEIESRLLDISKKISSDYEGKELVLIGILKGAFVFLADISRLLTIPVTIDFIRVSSYGDTTDSSGHLKLINDIELDIKNKNVLIVEDIVDSGFTLAYLIEHLKSFNPVSVKVCALIDKKERRKKNIKVDYFCHEIEGGFLVGYGLDYAENYRNLQGIYDLKL
ncbi:MAG: hypoxanthine phosphoribosyltransferase [Desulfobacterales bacterium]|nr:hypoxanthine phosphoribosyltransferase [Desulfobacterales bacterium]